jgi:hypothetical protein
VGFVLILAVPLRLPAALSPPDHCRLRADGPTGRRFTRNRTLATAVAVAATIITLAACGSNRSSSTGTVPAGPSARATAAASSAPGHAVPAAGNLKAAGAPAGFPVPVGFYSRGVSYAQAGQYGDSGDPKPAPGWKLLYVEGAADKPDATQVRDFFAAALPGRGWTVKTEAVQDTTYLGYPAHLTYVNAKAPAGSGFDFAQIRIFRSDEPGSGQSAPYTSIQINLSRDGYCAVPDAADSLPCPSGL